MKHPILVLFGLMASSACGATHLFSITIDYSGDAQYLPMFEEAQAIWEQLIPSYIDGQRGPSNFEGIALSATIGSIDGYGGVLGSAGWTQAAYDDSGYVLATAGSMRFDEADIGDLGSQLTTVILHEMGHVLGIGSLWTHNNLYLTGSGQYTGTHALSAYQAEFNQPDATFVPVELGGGPGTEDGHWNEVDNGAGFTGLVSSTSGSDMRYELMTGWLNTDEDYFISEMTLGSLRDIGYNIATPTIVPEISTFAVCVSAFGLILFRRRRV